MSIVASNTLYIADIDVYYSM